MKFISTLKQLFRENATTLFSMALLVVLPVVVSSGLAVFLYNYNTLLLNMTWPQMLLYYGIIAFTMAFALTPTTFVALVTGFYLGWIGFPGVVVSYGIAALIGYTLAQVIDHGKMMSFLNRFPKTMYLMQELRNESWSLIFLTRISPVLPFALMTFVLSIIKIPRHKFLIASMGGMLPRTLFFFWVGTQASNIISLLQDPDAGSLGKILMIGLVIISLFGLYYVFNKALKKALTEASGTNFTEK